MHDFFHRSEDFRIQILRNLLVLLAGFCLGFVGIGFLHLLAVERHALIFLLKRDSGFLRIHSKAHLLKFKFCFSNGALQGNIGFGLLAGELYVGSRFLSLQLKLQFSQLFLVRQFLHVGLLLHLQLGHLGLLILF